jgi:hypothetical protein
VKPQKAFSRSATGPGEKQVPCIEVANAIRISMGIVSWVWAVCGGSEGFGLGVGLDNEASGSWGIEVGIGVDLDLEVEARRLGLQGVQGICGRGQ